ncbi:MAG TPA: STAS domain-containing protein [Anaerolineales bacterium]|nr:STAS domain-containing protein [Anaerolineales bacterium]
MELQYSELENGIRVIKLIGTLDINGANSIDIKFTGHCAGQKVRVMVDLSEVGFVASMGIRMLVLSAKSVASRGGKMVLVNPTPDVKNVLEISGIPGIIPIYSDLESAKSGILEEKYA